jgi:hypothetical protein
MENEALKKTIEDLQKHVKEQQQKLEDQEKQLQEKLKQLAEQLEKQQNFGKEKNLLAEQLEQKAKLLEEQLKQKQQQVEELTKNPLKAEQDTAIIKLNNEFELAELRRQETLRIQRDEAQSKENQTVKDEQKKKKDEATEKLVKAVTDVSGTLATQWVQGNQKLLEQKLTQQSEQSQAVIKVGETLINGFAQGFHAARGTSHAAPAPAPALTHHGRGNGGRVLKKKKSLRRLSNIYKKQQSRKKKLIL